MVLIMFGTRLHDLGSGRHFLLISAFFILQNNKQKSISIAKGSGHFSIEWTSKENIDVEVPKDSTSNRHFEVSTILLTKGNGQLLMNFVVQ